jgi:predicted oxidoreductase
MKTTFSPVIAGTMTWGKWGKDLDTNSMVRLMHACLENGIDTFDHADIYGGHTTEESFGNAFGQSKIERQDIKLISKCGIRYPSDKRPLPIKYYEYSPEYIIWSVDESLKNLQTDYLDLLLLHRPSPLMKGDEIAETITHLKRDGKILDFGLSNFTPTQTDLIQQHTLISYNQIQFSLTHHEAMTDGSLDDMQLRNIRPMAWNPLGSVFREDIPQTQRIHKLLAKLETKYGVSGDVILIAWILKHPSQILPVCGTTNPSRIKELMKAPTLELELEDWFALWVESRGSKVP